MSAQPSSQTGFRERNSRNLRSIIWTLQLIPLVLIRDTVFAQSPAMRPVFVVDFPMPTADKPQSKLWYTENSWWALLPRSNGPSLWQRTKNGWQEHTNITCALTGCPSRADVWPESKSVTAVGVSDSTLTVFRLLKKTGPSQLRWTAQILARLRAPSPFRTMETATIARDRTGRWWVASILADQVYVWSASGSGKKWTSPILIGQNVHHDDICALTPIKNGIAVIWSDQNRDAVIIRQHQNAHPIGKWETEEVIQQGNKTADDHIKTSLSDQGTLWVATKNSLDQLQKPQLVLRVRSVKGHWSNKPYQNLESKKMPTRPAIFTTSDPSLVLSGYGDNYTSGGAPYHSQITFGLVDTTSTDVVVGQQVVIEPAKEYQDSFVQNITGPRNPFRADVPWIILASDQKGRVYEADLKQWFAPLNHTKKTGSQTK